MGQITGFLGVAAAALIFGTQGLTLEQVDFAETYQPGSVKRPPNPLPVEWLVCWGWIWLSSKSFATNRVARAKYCKSPITFAQETSLFPVEPSCTSWYGTRPKPLRISGSVLDSCQLRQPSDAKPGRHQPGNSLCHV